MLDVEDIEDQELAARISNYRKDQQNLLDILGGAMQRISSLDVTKNRWPAEGWDLATTVATLFDMLPRRTEAQLETWAREDLE